MDENTLELKLTVCTLTSVIVWFQIQTFEVKTQKKKKCFTVPIIMEGTVYYEWNLLFIISH